MEVFPGLAPWRGYTLGPAFLWDGWEAAPRLYALREPAIVVAPYIEEHLVDRLDPARVRGVVLDRASVIDPIWDRLAAFERPSIVGASGIWDVIRPGERVIIDGVGCRAVIRPTPPVLRRFQELRGTRPEPEPEPLRGILERLADYIRMNWQQRGRHLPFDLPEQRDLYELAHAIAAGGFPSEEDDAFLARLLLCAREDAPDQGYYEPLGRDYYAPPPRRPDSAPG